VFVWDKYIMMLNAKRRKSGSSDAPQPTGLNWQQQELLQAAQQQQAAGQPQQQQQQQQQQTAHERQEHRPVKARPQQALNWQQSELLSAQEEVDEDESTWQQQEPVKAQKQQQQQANSKQPKPPPTPRDPATPLLDLAEVLDDVQIRFIMNLPQAELASADRLFFQLEQAWWFYEDWMADAHPELPHFTLKGFAKKLFDHCPLLRPLVHQYAELFESFKSWKGSIPVAGCILLNPDRSKLVLVKNWKGNSRTLPRGKINESEPPSVAAAREVEEETGFDASALIDARHCISVYASGQQSTMFIVPGVPEDFPFAPKVSNRVWLHDETNQMLAYMACVERAHCSRASYKCAAVPFFKHIFDF
jgi:mRNA-decapping enzyme subunit 2